MNFIVGGKSNFVYGNPVVSNYVILHSVLRDLDLNFDDFRKRRQTNNLLCVETKKMNTNSTKL